MNLLHCVNKYMQSIRTHIFKDCIPLLAVLVKPLITVLIVRRDCDGYIAESLVGLGIFVVAAAATSMTMNFVLHYTLYRLILTSTDEVMKNYMNCSNSRFF